MHVGWSHGAPSPCFRDISVPTERGGYSSLFALEVVGYVALHYLLLLTFENDRPFATVGVITGIPAGVIGYDVINKIFLTCVRQLMHVAWPEKEAVACAHFSCALLVADAATAGNHQIKLRFRAVRVIGTIGFALRNSHGREIERMPFRQVERLLVTAQRY